ncbi:MAG TPA: hypothetical protein VFH33_03540 [Candidatus Krumholzibacteria bacterium]|nr:hypothetical protein [Candidatus Krumholzibacteria bacterium]
MCVALVVVLIAASALLRHFTGPDYIEKRLTRQIGPGYLIDIGSSHYNPLTRSFALANVSIVSDTLRTSRPKHVHPETHMKLDVRAVRATGLGLGALRAGRMDMNGLVLDRPKLTLYVDRQGMPVEHERPAVRMPHQVLLDSGRHIHIDTIRVIDGDVSYSERARTGVRPGIFRFADLNVNIESVNNDGTQREHPCVIDVHTRLADSGPLHAIFKYDLSSPVLRMDYNATIGKMKGTSLNDLLMDLNGIRVSDGTIDATRLDIKVDGDVAAGTMKFLYHGLKFEKVDKDTHDQGVRDHMISWMQNWQTHSSNPKDEDEPATVITLRRTRKPYVSLIKFVWETMREGMLRTLGVEGQ